ncbi:hypothetical protein F2Q69_00011705 [Brassica cretica]|uniref:NYN domain-containing protein n=1 Tax=Brassica cretica TaxID=69181 RepID=A0A8S9R0U6_BRACR|nr:hypothetical protein F2Q69_00011705 [Brassica cretica]
MKDCPIPEGYDAGRVRASLEAVFKERGYSGPVSISAYGDQTQTPGHILQGLVPTGISDIVEWRGQNTPPATMMIISDKVRGDIDWDLLRQQQRTRQIRCEVTLIGICSGNNNGRDTSLFS